MTVDFDNLSKKSPGNAVLTLKEFIAKDLIVNRRMNSISHLVLLCFSLCQLWKEDSGFSWISNRNDEGLMRDGMNDWISSGMLTSYAFCEDLGDFRKQSKEILHVSGRFSIPYVF
jgi:hypothetical protein